MANVKISELPAITTPAVADLVPVVQSGVTNKITRANFLKNPDAPADATKYLDGTGAWSVPAGSSGSVVDIAVIIGNGVDVISTGVVGSLEIPFACTINQVTLLADQSGSIVVDIWKDTYANYPPTVADTITASAKPTLSAAEKSQDSTLTGWTTSISAGDILRFNVDSATTVTRVTLSLKVTKS